MSGLSVSSWGRCVSIAVVLVGCGSDGGGDETPPPEETPLASFCAEAATARCGALEACGFLDPSFAGECESWHAQVLCDPLARSLSRAEVAGELLWLPSAGRRCVEALGASGCELGIQYDILAVPDCARALAPRAGEGASCTFAESCLEGNFCAFSAGCPGTCQSLAQINEACGEATPCAEGSFCPLTRMRCEAQSDVGAPCEPVAFGSSCRAGAFCDASQPGGEVCVAGRGRGNGCTRSEECAVGLSCVANRCSAGQTGDSCRDDRGCVGEGRCAAGLCVEAAGEGASCASDEACARGLRCGASGCTRGAADGEGCNQASDCQSGRCVSSVCRALLADGEVCTVDGDCLVGRRCVDNQCVVASTFCP